MGDKESANIPLVELFSALTAKVFDGAVVAKLQISYMLYVFMLCSRI